MSREHSQHTLIYQSKDLEPEDILNFWELPWFCDSWNDLKLDDQDLSALQILIMCDPESSPVMQGTKGLRKMRFSPDRWHVGKSGAARICYVYFRKYGLVLLCLAFKKGTMSNISSAGKKAINNAIERIERSLLEKYGF